MHSSRFKYLIISSFKGTFFRRTWSIRNWPERVKIHHETNSNPIKVYPTRNEKILASIRPYPNRGQVESGLNKIRLPDPIQDSGWD